MSGVFLTGINDIVVEFSAESTLAPGRAHAVVSKTSKKVKETMKSIAPRDTGEMEDSIGYSTRMHGGGAEGEIGPTATRDGFPYPAAVEWGTSKMPPQAFAGPSLDRHSSEFVDDIAMLVVQL